MALNYGQTFTSQTTVTIPGTTHGLGHGLLRVQIWDASTPRQRLVVPYTVHPSTFDVTVTFLQAQSGLIVLNGAAPSPPSLLGNRSVAFTNQTSVTILGTTHGYGTDRLLVNVYDASTPRLWLPLTPVTIHPSTFDVTVTFAQAQSGVIVLCAAADVGTANHGATFTGQTSVTILGSAHGRGTAALGVQVYDSATPAQLLLPGQVTVHPSTFDVVVSFLQAQSGVIVIGGSALTRLLLATLVGATTTPGAAQTMSRALSSLLAGVSTTPSAARLLVRGLTTVAAGTSSTPAIAVTQQRALSATTLATSTTPSATVQLATLRQLTATVPGASTTPAALATQQRQVIATLLGVSTTTTAQATISTQRALVAQVPGVSVTPAVTTQLLRRLSAAVPGMSVTPNAAAQMAGLRQLTAILAGSSATPSATPQVVHRLLTQVSGVTTTPAVASQVLRLLLAQPSTTSITPSAVVQQVRSLIAQPAAASTTPVSAITVLRRLSAAVSGVTTTPPALVQMVGLRQLSAAVLATSTTPTATPTQQHRLLATLAGTSATPAAPVLVATQRFFVATLAGTSTTPASLAQQQRNLPGYPQRCEYNPTCARHDGDTTAPDGGCGRGEYDANESGICSALPPRRAASSQYHANVPGPSATAARRNSEQR